MTRRAVARVDLTQYPDPAYRSVRAAIAAHRGLEPDRIVVGAGASELIHRLVGRFAAARTASRRAVLVLAPTFGEYRYAAEVGGVHVRTAATLDEFAARLDRVDVAFLCVPNNPDGRMPDTAWLAATADRAAAVGCRLVLDLAYWSLAQDPPAPPRTAWRLWAPNKPHGMTGIRAAWVELPDDDAAAASRSGPADGGPDGLRAAPSWIVSAAGVAFLHAVATDEADRWVARSRVVLWTWRDRLAAELTARGIAAEVGPANHLLAEVGDAGAVTAALRARGIRVRDATSFGRPTTIRLSAQSPPAVEDLLAALDEVGA